MFVHCLCYICQRSKSSHFVSNIEEFVLHLGVLWDINAAISSLKTEGKLELPLSPDSSLLFVLLYQHTFARALCPVELWLLLHQLAVNERRLFGNTRRTVDICQTGEVRRKNENPRVLETFLFCFLMFFLPYLNLHIFSLEP